MKFIAFDLLVKRLIITFSNILCQAVEYWHHDMFLDAWSLECVPALLYLKSFMSKS